MTIYYINPSKFIDKKMYKYIPEVYEELCKHDAKVRIISKNSDGTVNIDTDYGIRVVNSLELQNKPTR